ncbi:MAG: YcxB family protein [Clostridia bacterium]
MKCKLRITEEMQKELNSKALLTYLIMAIVGGVGLLSYIVIGTMHEYAWLDYLLYVSSVFFGIGLVFYITVKKSYKKNPNLNNTAEYELNEDHLVESIYKGDEQLANSKHYYTNIIKTRESKNYLFLFITAGAACVIPKNELSADELTLLKTWIEKAKQK